MVSATAAGVGAEGVLRELVAGTACGGDARAFLEFVEAATAMSDLAGDVAVGDPVADADDHDGRILMGMGRISKC